MSNSPANTGQSIAWRTAFLLSVGYMFSFVDRQMLAVLIEPIQSDLAITDTQFGLLHGLAFALFFALAGLPTGWLCDRFPRNRIIAAGVAIWSLSTAACGLASDFSSLFICRMGVGIGEAALAPCAYSLLSDLFKKQTLGRAIGVFSMGAQVGVAIAFFSSSLLLGWLGSVSFFGDLGLEPWQLVFVVIGLSGLPLALVILFFVPEPRKTLSAVENNPNVELPGVFQQAFLEPLACLKQSWRVYLPLFLGYSLFAMATFGFLAWMPAFFLRVLDFSQQSMGLTAGFMVLLFCPAGLVAAGWFVDWLDKRGYQDAAMRAGVFGACLMLVSVIMLAVSLGTGGIYIALATTLFLAPFPMTSGSVALQLATPSHLRGRISAIFLLAVALISQTLGPLNVALLSDSVFTDPGELGLSIALTSSVSLALAIIVLGSGMKAYASHTS